MKQPEITTVMARQNRFQVLASASRQELEKGWNSLDLDLPWQFLRQPEHGLVMLRGRMGGDGAPFNLGEASVTRCSVLFSGGIEGHAMTLGRDADKARLMALIDGASVLDEAWSQRVEAEIIAPLHLKQQQDAAAKAAETNKTKVNFFTLVRGEDAA